MLYELEKEEQNQYIQNKEEPKNFSIRLVKGQQENNNNNNHNNNKIHRGRRNLPTGNEVAAIFLMTLKMVVPLIIET